MTTTFSNGKTYKIRTFVNGKRKNGDPFINYSLTIPVQIAEILPVDMRFTCELTDDGILFKPHKEKESRGPALPTWAVTNNGSQRR